MRKLLDRPWRIIGTTLFLLIIGVGGTLLACTVFPGIAAVTPCPKRRQRRIRSVIHYSFKLYCAAIRGLGIADIEIIGTEHGRALRGTLIVANHISLLDVVMIMSAVPDVQCIVKAGLWRHPFFQLTVRGAGYIRNDLEPELLMQACVDSLNAGNNLLIFPQGTRTLPDQAVKFHRGVANIATIAGADIQVMTIGCHPLQLHKGNPWWCVAPSKPRFILDIGQRLSISDFMSAPHRALAARKLISYLQDYYEQRRLLRSNGHVHATGS